MQEMQDPFLGWEDPLEKDTQTYTHTCLLGAPASNAHHFAPGEGNSQPTPVFYLEAPMDRGAWWATAQEVTKELDTTFN